MGVLDLFSLKNKKVLVTGGSSGLGRAMSIAMAEAGADIAVCDINEDRAAEVSFEIERLGRKSIAIKVDVTSRVEVTAMVTKVVETFGTLDIACNNAGMSGGGIPAEEENEDHWKKVLDTNLNSIFYCAQAEAAVMIKKGGGKIINTASMSGFIVNKGMPVTAYCTSKGGVVMMTKSLAVEWAKYNIMVNAIGPGFINTELVKNLMNDDKYRKTMMEDLTPLGRVAEPIEFAGVVVFLASEASKYMTGHTLVVDGGYTLW